MNRRPYGTRFTTGCGHSWRRRYPKWTIAVLAGATTDCSYVIDKTTGEHCDELLIIPALQFWGKDPGNYPAEVHMPLFHRYMNNQDPQWPADGAGTYSVSFAVEEG